MKKIYLSFVLAILSLRIYAQPGALDLPFGAGGIAYTNILNATNGNESASAVVLQPDRKIIVSGNAGGFSCIYRYNSDGSLDDSFDKDGKLFFPKWGIAGIALQADGKLVAVGSVSNGTDLDFAIIRFNTDGTIDNEFGTGGEVLTDFNNLKDQAGAVAVQTDGKIIVAGVAEVSTNPTKLDFALARYNTDGSLDNDLDEDGKQTIPVSPSLQPQVSIVIQNDGKIVVGGSTLFSSGFDITIDFILMRFNTDGSLDNSFDGDGKVTTNFGPGSSSAILSQIALQGDGRIVAGGSFRGDFAIARFNTDGSLDNSFDGDGRVTTDFNGASDALEGMAIQSDGKIVAAGSSHTSVNASAMARYNTDGSLDNKFDGDGLLITNFGSPGTINAVAIQTDGNIIVAGVAQTLPVGNHIALARYLQSDGSPDPSFDGDGIVVTTISSSYDLARAIAVQRDGKIVVAGYTTPINFFVNPQFALTRYNTDGSLDNSFDGDGILTPTVSVFARANAVAIQPDGKIVVAGASRIGNNDPYDFAIARFNADGTADSTFDNDGVVFTPIGTSDDYATSLVIQPDGKLVVAGYSNVQLFGNTFALVRYNPNGSLDNTFDGDGKQTTTFDFESQANSVAIQADGKIVAAGYTYKGPGFLNSFALARYNHDGSLDNSFDGDGKVTTDIFFNSIANSVTIQSDGRIIAAGYADDFNPGSVPALTRYNGDGSLDSTFDSDGILTTPIASSYKAIAQSVAVEGDGKILVAGRNEALNTLNKNVVLTRYNTEGGLDSSFGDNGIVNKELLGTAKEEGWAMTLYGNRIYVAGTIVTESQEDFLVAVFKNDVVTCPGTTVNTYYRDEDGDGFGNPNLSIEACSLPEGYADNNTDCDDKNAAVNPGTAEICGNHIDDNCDGRVDEDCHKLPKIYITNTAVREGNDGTRNASFDLGLSKPGNKPITVEYHTADRTAQAPEDYEQKSGTVTFPPNTRTQKIVIKVKGDRLPEANERFAIILSDAVNGVIYDGRAVCTIIDDDPVPAITIQDAVADENCQQASVRVSLSESSKQVVTIKYYTKDGSAKAPEDYKAISNGTLVFQPGEITKNISIVIKEDALCEPTEKFYVILYQAENASLNCREAEVRILNSDPANNVMSKGAPATQVQPDKNRMIVSPNPANQAMNIRLLAKTIKGEIRIELLDQNGKIIKQWIKNYYSEEQSLSLPVADIPGGIYTVVVKDGKGNWIGQHVVIGH